MSSDRKLAGRPIYGMEVSDYRLGDSVRFTAFGRNLRYTGTVVNVGLEYVICRIGGSLSSLSGSKHRVDADNIQLI